MNPPLDTAPRFDPALLDRWLDGHATPDDEASFIRSVEADPEATAALVDALLLEAELRPLLRPAAALRPPLHVARRRSLRAVKWIAASTAVAASIAAAVWWVVPHFAESPAGGIAAQSDASPMKITRYENGHRPAKREWPALAPAAVQPQTPLIMHPPFVVPRNLPESLAPIGHYRGSRLSIDSLVPPNLSLNDTAATLLRWNGHPLPAGAWLRTTKTAQGTQIEMFSTQENHSAAYELFHGGNPAPRFNVEARLFFFAAGEPLAGPLAKEAIISHDDYRDATKMTIGDFTYWVGPQRETSAPPESELRMLLDQASAPPSPDAPQPYPSPESEIRMLLEKWRFTSLALQMDVRFWQPEPGVYRLAGFCGMPAEYSMTYGPPARIERNIPTLAAEETDLEFDITLRGGQAAVIHPGKRADGRRCALLLHVAPAGTSAGSSQDIIRWIETMSPPQPDYFRGPPIKSIPSPYSPEHGPAPEVPFPSPQKAG